MNEAQCNILQLTKHKKFEGVVRAVHEHRIDGQLVNLGMDWTYWWCLSKNYATMIRLDWRLSRVATGQVVRRIHLLFGQLES